MISTNRSRSDHEPPDERASAPSATDDQRPPRTRYSYLILLLGRLDGPVTIDRVADAVVRWERDHAPAGEDPDEKTWYDVHEELFLVDLPVLDRADIVEFDRGRGLVTCADGSPPLS